MNCPLEAPTPSRQARRVGAQALNSIRVTSESAVMPLCVRANISTNHRGEFAPNPSRLTSSAP